MIDFRCEHCGNHLASEDDYAGQDRWCRVCKNAILALREVREEINARNVEIAGCEVEVESLQNELKEHASQAGQSDTQLTGKETELDRVSTELNDTLRAKQKAEKAFEILRKSSARFATQLSTANSELETLRERAQLSEKHWSKLANTLDKANTEIARLEQALVNARREPARETLDDYSQRPARERMRSDLDAEQARRETVERQLADSKAELDEIRACVENLSVTDIEQSARLAYEMTQNEHAAPNSTADEDGSPKIYIPPGAPETSPEEEGIMMRTLRRFLEGH